MAVYFQMSELVSFSVFRRSMPNVSVAVLLVVVVVR